MSVALYVTQVKFQTASHRSKPSLAHHYTSSHFQFTADGPSSFFVLPPSGRLRPNRPHSIDLQNYHSPPRCTHPWVTSIIHIRPTEEHFHSSLCREKERQRTRKGQAEGERSGSERTRENRARSFSSHRSNFIFNRYMISQ